MDTSRILLVDDDLNILKMIEQILIQAGYHVSLAKSGKQALCSLLNGCNPDLVLLDVNMSEMDGYETLELIRNIDNCADVPVIFLTGMDDVEAELKGLRLGAIDYIVVWHIKRCSVLHIKWSRCVITSSKKVNLFTVVSAK